jgi:hypothetical protein
MLRPSEPSNSCEIVFIGKQSIAEGISLALILIFREENKIQLVPKIRFYMKKVGIEALHGTRKQEEIHI